MEEKKLGRVVKQVGAWDQTTVGFQGELRKRWCPGDWWGLEVCGGKSRTWSNKSLVQPVSSQWIFKKPQGSTVKSHFRGEQAWT